MLVNRYLTASGIVVVDFGWIRKGPKLASFEQNTWILAHGFEHGGFWKVLGIAPNSLKRLLHSCKWISNYLRDSASGLGGSQFGRFWAKSLRLRLHPRLPLRPRLRLQFRVSDWNVPCKNRSFVWFPNRSLLTTGQCSFLRQILPDKCCLPSMGRVSPCRNRTASHIIRCKLCDELSFVIQTSWRLSLMKFYWGYKSRLGGLWRWGTGNLCCIYTLISAFCSRVPRQ